MNEVIKKLDQLAKVRSVIKSLAAEETDILRQALLNCPDLQEKYEKIRNELAYAEVKEGELVKAVKEAVIKHKESVKGEELHAIYNKGRVSWDTNALTGYAASHPEINEFKKVGKPSVTIREVKN